jgi:hypothetical protein
MGKRPAEVESFVGNMGSMQWEDTAFYAKRRTADHGNGTRTNSSKSCCDHSCISHTGSCKLSLRCKPTSDERSAENPHATFRGSRRRVTASGHPVPGEKELCYLARGLPYIYGKGSEPGRFAYFAHFRQSAVTGRLTFFLA